MMSTCAWKDHYDQIYAFCRPDLRTTMFWGDGDRGRSLGLSAYLEIDAN
jgi:hypothetical protein